MDSRTQWARARTLHKRHGPVRWSWSWTKSQKVRGWSENRSKRLWDEDRRRKQRPRSMCCCLDRSSLLLPALGSRRVWPGRFFLHRCPHWSWAPSLPAGPLDGAWIAGSTSAGYPGAGPPGGTGERVAGSMWPMPLIETVLAARCPPIADLGQAGLAPPPLRAVGLLPCPDPGVQQRCWGQLQDAGNTTTLAHYLRLLEKPPSSSRVWNSFRAASSAKRGSSPKLVLWKPGPHQRPSRPRTFEQAKNGRRLGGGRLVENAVGRALG